MRPWRRSSTTRSRRPGSPANRPNTVAVMRRVVVLIAVVLTVAACARDAAPEPAAPEFTGADAQDLCVRSVQHYLDWELDDPDAYSRATENGIFMRCEDLLDEGVRD